MARPVPRGRISAVIALIASSGAGRPDPARRPRIEMLPRSPQYSSAVCNKPCSRAHKSRGDVASSSTSGAGPPRLGQDPRFSDKCEDSVTTRRDRRCKCGRNRTLASHHRFTGVLGMPTRIEVYPPRTDDRCHDHIYRWRCIRMRNWDANLFERVWHH